MLDRQELTDIIRAFEPEAEFTEGTQLTEAIVPAEKLFALAEKLKADKRTAFNYLIDETAVDFSTHFTVVYHLDSTDFRHMLVLKTKITDRGNPVTDSFTALYPTAEYYEREIFDLFGIRFNNHPNLKRFYMEDDYGYPLRKDFSDELNIIER